MVAGINGQTQIDTAMKVFMGELQLVSDHDLGVMEPLVDRQNLPTKMGRVWHEPLMGATTAATLTDGVEFDSPQQMGDAEITCTPSEKGAQILWTHRMADTVSFSFPKVAAEVINNGIQYKKDRDILDQGDSFPTIGGATTTLTVGLIAAGGSIIRAGRGGTDTRATTYARATGDMPKPPFNAVFHEYSLHDLFSQLSSVGGAPTQVTTGAAVGNYSGNTVTDYQKQWLESYYVGNVRGIKVHVDNNFTFQTDGGTYIKGLIFAKRAMGVVNFGSVKNKIVETDDGRAMKQTVVIDYGTFLRADAWGRECDVDVTVPAT